MSLCWRIYNKIADGIIELLPSLLIFSITSIVGVLLGASSHFYLGAVFGVVVVAIFKLIKNVIRYFKREKPPNSNETKREIKMEKGRRKC